MMPQSTRQRTARHDKKRAGLRPPIEPNVVYSYPDASVVIGAAQITLRRAVDAGHLRARRIGRKVFFLGSDLLEWIAGGGATGRNAFHVAAERNKAA